MNIHEYQAKELFRKFNIPVPEGIIILSEQDINELLAKFIQEKYVVKAQIHAGGRGKAGGIKITSNKEEAKNFALSLFGKKLVTKQTGNQGRIVKKILVERGYNIKQEFYLSLTIDRENSNLIFIASASGGVNIEEVANEDESKIIKIPVSMVSGNQPFHCRLIAYRLGLKDDNAKKMMKIINNIYQLFVQYDTSQVEINPLAITDDNELLALDAKINFDDNGLFRHSEIQKMRDKDEEDELEAKAKSFDLNYVRMNGIIGCMGNGAGLAMATMDIISIYGQSPANFLDVGGNADEQRVQKALEIICSDDNVKAILVNIFGGIMQCDIIARGIVSAVNKINLNIPLVVRLSGTNAGLAKKILADAQLNIIAANNLDEAAKKIAATI